MRRLPLCGVVLLALSPVEGLSLSIARRNAQPTPTALTIALGAELDQFAAPIVDGAQSPDRKRVIQPPGYKPTPSPLSPGILVGDTLYLSGSTGGDPVTGQLVSGGFEPELRQIMANVQTVLAAADMRLSDVVSVTAYLAEMSDFARFNELYKEYFTSTPLPTRSTVAVKELARGARLELTMTAVRAR